MIYKIAMFMITLAFSTSTYAIELHKIIPGQVLRGHFTQDRTLPGFKAPLHSEGTFIITSDGIIWDTTRPFASRIVISPQGLTQEMNGEKVMDLPANTLPFFQHLNLTLRGMMAGNWDALAHDFTITQKGTDDHWQVNLVPRAVDNPNIPVTSMRITGGKFVNQVMMTRNDNSTDTLVFSHQTISSEPLSDTQKSAFD